MDLSKLHLHWRSRTRGDKVYKSYSLAKAVWENGKNRKEIVLKLGSLSDEEAERWRLTLRAWKNPSILTADQQDIAIISNRAYLDVAVLKEMWNSWRLDEVFDQVDDETQRGIPLSSLAALLAINRCLDPTSKSRVSAWAKQTTWPLLERIPSKEINSSRIFRELAAIESCKDQLCQHLCKCALEQDPESMQTLFYDLSSTTFSGTRCVLVSWGHCKEGYENHIVLALIVNTRGLPIYWEVLEGSTADAKTISWLLERLKEKLPLAVEAPTMVFDRGMVSDDNLTLLEEAGMKYISAMDKNQIEEATGVDFLQYADMTPETVIKEMNGHLDFVRLDDNTYCKEVCVKGMRRYVLCFNAQLFRDQRKAREDQLAELGPFVEKQNDELLEAKMKRSQAATQEKFDVWLRRAKLRGFVNVELEEKYVPKKTKHMLKAILSYQGLIHIDEKKKREAGKLDGFWLLVTNQLDKNGDRFVHDTRAVVQPYRQKVVIESSFRDIKSFIEISPVHVWKEEHVRAHYTICVLGHLLDRTLSLALHAKTGDATKEIISHERLYEELGDCQLNRLRIGPKKDQYRLTEPTEKQVELLERLGMQHLVQEETIAALTAGKIGDYV